MTESSQQQQHWRNTSTLSGDRLGHVEFVRHRTQTVVGIFTNLSEKNIASFR